MLVIVSHELEVIKLSLEEPSLISWISVKVCKSHKGRLQKPYEVYTARVSIMTLSTIYFIFSNLGLAVTLLTRPRPIPRQNIQTYSLHMQVKQVNDEGLTVSFKEKHDNFYVRPEKEELSYPIKREEVVVLKAPTSVNENRTNGFRFGKHTKTALQSYFVE